MKLKIPNIELPEPRFILQNRISNHLNHPKKTESRTKFIPSLIPIEKKSQLHV